MAEESVRIDVWMWRARFYRSRELAAAAAADGRIRLVRAGIERRVRQSSQPVRVGDELTFAAAARVVAVRVLGLGARRGPAAEARGLYEPLDAPERH